MHLRYALYKLMEDLTEKETENGRHYNLHAQELFSSLFLMARLQYCSIAHFTLQVSGDSYCSPIPLIDGVMSGGI